MIRVVLQNLLAAALFLWARKRGGAPEWVLAGILMVSLWLNLVLRYVVRLPTIYGNVDPGSLLFDVWMLVAAVWIALKSNRTWPLWFSALQVIALTSHFLREVSHKIEPMTYSVLMRAPTYAQLVVLFIAMIACRRRSTLGIRANDWRR